VVVDRTCNIRTVFLESTSEELLKTIPVDDDDDAATISRPQSFTTVEQLWSAFNYARAVAAPEPNLIFVLRMRKNAPPDCETIAAVTNVYVVICNFMSDLSDRRSADGITISI